MSPTRTVGVEEELHLVDPVTRHPTPVVDAVLPRSEAPAGSQIEREIKREMIETGSSVCSTGAELLADLRGLRATIAAAAAREGAVIASCGLLPTSDWRTSEYVADDRYHDISRLYAQLMDEQVVCGLHVHVGIEDRAVGVEVLNRIGPWLPPLLALSASSPLFEGRDTGYSSYRSMVFWRMPVSGTPGRLADVEEYDTLVADIIATGAVVDAGQIYWPARLSAKYPTIELRVADAVPTVEEATLQAILSRAIVTRLVDDVVAGRDARLPFTDELGPRVRDELVRAAWWQAARFGLSQELLDLRDRTRRPAHEAIRALCDQLEPELTAAADVVLCHRLLDEVLVRGGPADRMRAAAAKGGAKGATDLVVRETAGARHGRGGRRRGPGSAHGHDRDRDRSHGRRAR